MSKNEPITLTLGTSAIDQFAQYVLRTTTALRDLRAGLASGTNQEVALLCDEAAHMLALHVIGHLKTRHVGGSQAEAIRERDRQCVTLALANAFPERLSSSEQRDDIPASEVCNAATRMALASICQDQPAPSAGASRHRTMRSSAGCGDGTAGFAQRPVGLRLLKPSSAWFPS